MTADLEITRLGESGGKGFERVFAYLREQLLDGTLKQGERLMAERELAAQLGVSRPIVREALRALHMLGIVEIRERVGTIVKRPDLDAQGLLLARARPAGRPHRRRHGSPHRDRVPSGASRLRTRHHRRFRAIAARARPHQRDDRRCRCGRSADFDFHRAIVLASRSPTLAVLHQSMSTLLARSHRSRRELVQQFSSMKSYLIDDHQRVFDTIVGRDPDRAEGTLRRHFAIGDEYRRRAVTGEGDRPEARSAQPEAPHSRDGAAESWQGQNQTGSIGFIGLGTMGREMVRNLLKAGHAVTVFDLSRTPWLRWWRTVQGL